MIPAKPYFYNSFEELTTEDYEKAVDIAVNKLRDYSELMEDFERWKELVKNYNKFCSNKYYRKETSRYAWHKEQDEFQKRVEEFENASKENVITTAYNDAFYHEGTLYYPVDHPQIFRIALSLQSVNQLYNEENKALVYLQNLPDTCILGATDEDHVEWKEISNNISEFFKKYPKGLLFISNGIN